MSKITNDDGLTRSGTGCFMLAVPTCQQWASRVNDKIVVLLGLGLESQVVVNIPTRTIGDDIVSITCIRSVVDCAPTMYGLPSTTVQCLTVGAGTPDPLHVRVMD